MGIEVGNCTIGNVGKNGTGDNVGCSVGAGVPGTGFEEGWEVGSWVGMLDGALVGCWDG